MSNIVLLTGPSRDRIELEIFLVTEAGRGEAREDCVDSADGRTKVVVGGVEIESDSMGNGNFFD